VAARLRPGLGYRELLADLPEYPAVYDEQRYSFVLHGIGTDDEPPFVPFPDAPEAAELDGEFRENMVVSVEFYAGEVGGQDGVKLEDEVWISAGGPVMLSLYPPDERLLAGGA
jgi:Xaa-Pro aminopeptidase